MLMAAGVVTFVLVTLWTIAVWRDRGEGAAWRIFGASLVSALVTMAAKRGTHWPVALLVPAVLVALPAVPGVFARKARPQDETGGEMSR